MGNQSFDRNRVIVLSVIHGSLSATAAAARYGVSRQWVQELLRRYREEGEAGLQPRSRAPRSSPSRTPSEHRDRILVLRAELDRQGMDHGAESIAARLERDLEHVPSVTTIWRILRDAGLVTPQPQKRPRSSYIRFEAAQPNETWQSDFTHWRLADGTDTEIISWLDDHSRSLLHATAHARITGPIVTTTFTATALEHGLPASTLTDNGMVFTTRFAGGRGGQNGFESLLRSLGIIQKNGAPSHPQTQGKIERFHQTLKRWLSKQPPPEDLPRLQQQLDRFRHLYNHERPHRALQRRTPATAYAALPKAEPVIRDESGHWRVRLDTISSTGTISLRHAGRLRHLGIGRAHKGRAVIVLIHGAEILTAALDSAELLAQHTIDPDRDYQPKTT